jgi:hypothetical protein
MTKSHPFWILSLLLVLSGALTGCGPSSSLLADAPKCAARWEQRSFTA